MLPFGWLTFTFAISDRKSSMLSPYAASFCGSASTLTAGTLPPAGVTKPTPGTSEIFAPSRLLATSCNCVSDIELDVTAKVRMG